MYLVILNQLSLLYYCYIRPVHVMMEHLSIFVPLYVVALSGVFWTLVGGWVERALRVQPHPRITTSLSVAYVCIGLKLLFDVSLDHDGSIDLIVTLMSAIALPLSALLLPITAKVAILFLCLEIALYAAISVGFLAYVRAYVSLLAHLLVSNEAPTLPLVLAIHRVEFGWFFSTLIWLGLVVLTLSFGVLWIWRKGKSWRKAVT